MNHAEVSSGRAVDCRRIKARVLTRFKSGCPDYLASSNPANGCESNWRRDLNSSEFIKMRYHCYRWSP
jgi:hypothetical protein